MHAHAVAAAADFLGVPAGGWLVGLVALISAVLGTVGIRLGRTTPQAIGMTDAWARIERLEKSNEATRRAIRIQEEGNDAWWSWSLRVKGIWGRSSTPPEFTAEEDRAIRRARRSLEIADTGPTTVPHQ